MASTILVFGSINIDVTAYGTRLPRPGETVKGESLYIGLGGKAANQAVAAARLGSWVALIGCVGADWFGDLAVSALRTAGVTVDGVSRTEDHHTGIALIAVGQSGENQIIVVPGASQQLTASQADPFIREAKVLLTQLEAPPQASLQVSQIAKAAGAIIIHDPAPAPYMALDQAHFEVIDIITPNVREALALTGIDASSDEGAKQAAHALRNMGATTAVVKLGRRGCYVSGPQMERLVPAFPVATIDTVGAGDAFNGGLAHALAEGWPFEAAIRFAAACGALATTVRGSADAAPRLQAVQDLLRTQNPLHV